MVTAIKQPPPYDLFLFCGEPSGDLHGEALIQSLLEQHPNLVIAGVGGPRMRKLPFHCILPMEEFQVMGFVDVFCALPRILRHFYSLAEHLLQASPKAALFIDYPGFALRLEAHLRKKQFKGKLIHYICPSVWAHGKSRIPLMEKNLDLLLTIFPFEKTLFSASFPVEYVGHPLVDRVEKKTEQILPWGHGKKIVSIFPGSRKKEILRNFPFQIRALQQVLSENVIGAVSLASPTFLPILKKCLEKEGLSFLEDKLYFVPAEDSYTLMQNSYCAIAKSGTVTLELALHKVPTVVLYAISPLDLFIAKHLIRVNMPFYCIVNILANKKVFEELIGPALTDQALQKEVKNLLNPAYHTEKKALCNEIPDLLGTKKASQETARLVLGLLT